MLSYMPMVGLNIAVPSMIGRSVGAGDLARANEVIGAAFLIGIFYSGVLALLYVPFRYPLVDSFAPPVGEFGEIRELAAFMMLGLASYTIGDAVIQVGGGEAPRCRRYTLGGVVFGILALGHAGPAVHHYSGVGLRPARILARFRGVDSRTRDYLRGATEGCIWCDPERLRMG